MKRKLFCAIASIMFAIPIVINAQNKDKAVFRTLPPGFYQNSILRDDREARERAEPARPMKMFAVDLSSSSLPNKFSMYRNQQWHNPPVSQGSTSTCWCFCTTSFLESEIYRIHKMKVKLSEMYTVYWEYVEKARRFIRERGNSLFDEGSEANAVTRMWSKYGIVPYEDYTGLLNGRKFHNTDRMREEMQSYLQSVKESSSWDEDAALATIKSIMNHYMGEPPAEITVNGEKMTPVQYLRDILKINPGDYVDILSYTQEPFYKKVEYQVPDNWWHNSDYHNVPLDVFMTALKNAVRKGYTVSIGGDVSEPGFDRVTQCAVIPDFDIPSAYINDDARQFRFSNRTTTDDHGMHLVGYLEKDGKDWYLVKDSGSGSRNNDPDAAEFGYYFFSEDYVKLKMMDFMVHKDAVKELLQKF
ncbi:MAG TPA: C1 family peptidase [Bacteroidales bacterium]|nr:C1 family peptidase [Bacteroidales bacterium]HPM18156.1 C1 family peptidase [Bacteroidales bacterium]